MNTIGILTSGGDSPGMNACVAAIVRDARGRGLKAVGILRGFEGFVEGRALELKERDVAGVSGKGGTFLMTSRNGALKAKLKASDISGMYDKLGIDSLIVLGGGGSMAAAGMIADAGFPVVTVPCTIDNDVKGTDYTIGFDTACNHVIRAADEITDTGQSLEGRVFLIETLGGDTGHIAVASALAIGADAVLVPEVKSDLEAVCNRLRVAMDGSRPYSVIVVAEGAGPAQKLVDPIADLTGRRVRVTALGHAQRGGNPTYWDRTMARRFGEMAVRLLADGETGVMTAMSGGVLIDVPLSIPCGGAKPFDLKTYNLVNRFAGIPGG